MQLIPAQPSDCPTLARLISLAFATPQDQVQGWLDNAGLSNFRVLVERPGETPVACCLRVPMGHFFGGRSVPVLGIAGVAVAPEQRGRGLATVMMEAALREARAEGAALSSLYPATLPLYRRVGYEQAGYWCEYRLPLSRLRMEGVPKGDERLHVRAYNPEKDREALTRCYTAFALQHHGMLDRGDYIWGRIFKPRQGDTSGFIVEGSGGVIEGYVFLRQERNPDYKHDLHLTDLAASTPEAGRRLLDLLSDFRSIGHELVFNGGPLHPLVTLLDEQKFRLTLREYWMLRIVDVEKALTGRGYNPHISAEFTIEVSDTSLPENAGPWRVRIADGKASVSRGGESARGMVRVNERSLAAMYSGFMSPQHLRSIGRLEGDEQGVSAASAVFASAVPSLQDMF